MTEKLFNTAINNQYHSSIKAELEPYEMLSNAIVEQAVIDYRKATADIKIAKQRLREDPNDEKAIKLLKRSYRMHTDCNRFFRSEWFSFLTKVDGGRLLRALKEEAA